ncbi:hypothetical protein ACHAWU_005113 [Discostella pseudostelligera]|uniref:Uncharacterized protein n=1 Tax=Discostella pseudostelligera TaxID=259834 RepID=A0ABD3M292_9STRA
MKAALLPSHTIIDSGSKTDILFPYKVFLRMDAVQSLECNDGGYGGGAGRGAGGGGWEEDWKTRPRYGHHIDVKSVSLLLLTGRFHARHYNPHTFTNRDRDTRLSSKQIIACVDYILFCLNDEDCVDQAEDSLLQWLLHICSRPEYIVDLPFEYQLADALHALSIWLNRAFSDGGYGEDEEVRGILPSMDSSDGGHRSISRRRGPIPQECLLTACKCVSAIIYNTTTRLGIGMQLFLRPVVRLVSTWAEVA